MPGQTLELLGKRGISEDLPLPIERWIERSTLDFGRRGAAFLARSLQRVANGPKIRNPTAFAVWASREPLGRWIPDRDLDELYRTRAERQGEVRWLRDEPEPVPIGWIAREVCGTI